MLPADPVRYHLGYLKASARTELDKMLAAGSIEHVWVGNVLHVAGAQDDEAFALVAEVEADGYKVEPEVLVRPDPPDADPVVGPGRRAVGAALDHWLLSVLVAFMIYAWVGFGEERSRSTSERVGVVAVYLAIHATYIVGTTAVAGRTPMMRFLGTKIVKVADGGPPGLRVAAVRFGVWWAPQVLTFVPRFGGLLVLVGILAISMPIFRRADRRGIHDLVAGTVVVEKWWQGAPPLRSRPGSATPAL